MQVLNGESTLLVHYHKLFSATFNFCSDKIGNKKIEGSPLKYSFEEPIYIKQCKLFKGAMQCSKQTRKRNLATQLK